MIGGGGCGVCAGAAAGAGTTSVGAAVAGEDVVATAGSAVAGSVGGGSVAAGSSGESGTGTCAGCHGVPGYSNAYPQYPVPKIAGQNEQYIINALHGYQSGDRTHVTMAAQAQSLSDTDIQNIAAYLSSLAK